MALVEVLGDTPPEKLDQPCRDRHLCEIACCITHWRALSPFMGITAAEEDEIEGKWPRSIQRQRIEVLRKWKRKHRGKRRGKMKNTYRSLCKTFAKAGEIVLIEEVCRILRSEQSSSESSSGDSEGDVPPPKMPLMTPTRTNEGTLPICDTAPPLERYVQSLREVYSCQIPYFFCQWPPPPTHRVFNLAMFLSDETIRRKPLDPEVAVLAHRGNVSDIMGRKMSIMLKDLFKTSSARRQVVLIEGAPGSGKSTLAWHVCQQWESRVLFQEFKIVVYVQLRDPEIQSAKSLVDLFPTHPGIRREDVVTALQLTFGEGVLFVLDGWDEYQPGLRQGTLLHKLISNPEKLHLHHSTLLITSRPVASAELQPCAAARVEIVGFDSHELLGFFAEAIGDPVAVQKLQDELEKHPVIEASCYLPLNAAIVAHIFMELNSTLPRTLHGVFSALVYGCIRRYLKKQTGREEEILSLDHLPPDLQAEFQRICALAFQGSLENKVTFSAEELQHYGLSSEANPLDLMQVVPSFASCRSKVCYFLHLSIQEMLAAWHISRLSPSEQVQVVQATFNNPRFPTIFQFYAAITKFVGIRYIIAQSGQKQPLLSLMHYLYEAQDVSLCCFVASQLNGAVELGGVLLSPLDYLSLGYFLSCVCPSSGQELKVDLSQCSLDDHSINLLVKGLSMFSPSLEYSSSCDETYVGLVLDLSSNSITGRGVQYLSEVISHSNTIGRLDLSSNKIQQGDDGLKHLLQALRTNTSLTHLRLESITDLTITKESGVLLAAMLKENSTLQELDLSNIHSLTDQDLATLGGGLKRNCGLKTLTVKSLGRVTVEGWRQFLSCLKENDHLVKLTTQAIDQMGGSILHREVRLVNELRHQKCLPPLEIHPLPTSELSRAMLNLHLPDSSCVTQT